MSKSRYEREIEEILSKYDEESGRSQKATRQEPPRSTMRWSPPSAPPRTQPRRGQFTMPNLKRLSAGQYMVAAFGLAILSVLLSNNVPPLITTAMLLAAVVLFFVPVVLYYKSGATGGGWTPREEKRWRGQVIDFNTRKDVTNDPLAGVKRWLRRR